MIELFEEFTTRQQSQQFYDKYDREPKYVRD
jgi:hypothetical protein